MTAIERAFTLYIQGYSLRKLSCIFKIPTTTLAYKFRKRYGNDYTQLKNKNGLIPIIKEYLVNPNLSIEDKRKIKQWMNSNCTNILASDKDNSNIPLYTEKKIEQLTRQECFHKDKDLKTLFEATLTY